MISRELQINISSDKLNWYTLDIEDDNSFGINMSVADITDVKKRTGSGSYQITIANTDNNHRILNNIFDITSNNYKYVREKTFCQVVYNNNVLLDEYFFIVEDCIIAKDNLQNDYITYKARVANQVTNFYQMIDGKLLTDMQYEEYNHIYTSSVVVDSFDKDYTHGFKYCLPYEYSTTPYQTKDFFPGIFTRTYWDKIHEYAGYNYEFDEMNNPNILFNRLMHPFVGDVKKILDRDYDSYNSVVDRTNTWSFYNEPGFQSGRGIISSNTKVKYDIQNYVSGSEYWDGNTERYVVPATITNPSSLTFNISTNYDVLIENITAYGMVNAQPAQLIKTKSSLTPYLEVYNVTKGTILLNQRLDVTEIMGTGHAYGGDSVEFDSTKEVYMFNAPIYVPPSSTKKLYGSGNQSVMVSLNVTDVEINDNIEFRFRLDYINDDGSSFNWQRSDLTSPVNVKVKFRVDVKSFKIEQVANFQTLLTGLPILLHKMVPQNIKQSEYLSSIMNMFNLYAYIDPFDSKRIIYKTRDKFYKDGKDLGDMSDIVDLSKGTEIKYLPGIDTKKQILTYKYDANDPFHKTYKNTTDETYGEQTVIYDNDNTKGTKKNELIFASTANVTTSFGANIPLLPATPDVSMRILLFNGMKDCNAYHISDTVSGINKQNMVTYPHISMLNDVERPTFSIEFGIGEFYEFVTRPTYNNLYFNHHKNMFALLNASSIVTVYMNLTPDIMSGLQMNETLTINNQKYLISKIYNYSPSNIYTKVDLITLIETYTEPRTRKPIFTGTIVSGVSLTDSVVTVMDSVGNVISVDPVPNPTNDDIEVTVTDTAVNVLFDDLFTPMDGYSDLNTNTIKPVNIKEVLIQNLDSYRRSNNIYNKPSNQMLGDGNTINSNVTNTIILSSNKVIEKSNTIYSDSVETIAINGIDTKKLLSLIDRSSVENILYADFEQYRSPGVYYITDRDIYFTLDFNYSYSFYRYVNVIKPTDFHLTYKANATYAIGDMVVYSNEYYENISGTNVGSGNDLRGLDNTEWELLEGYTIPYRVDISYDAALDKIYSATDSVGNNTIYDLDSGITGYDYIKYSTWSNTNVIGNKAKQCIANNTGSIKNNVSSGQIIDNLTTIISGNSSGDIVGNTSVIISDNNVRQIIAFNEAPNIIGNKATNITGCINTGDILDNNVTNNINVVNSDVTFIMENTATSIEGIGTVGAIQQTLPVL